MIKPKKLGFYRKSEKSNKRLIDLFERNQMIRYASSNKDWEDKNFLDKLVQEEKTARAEILKMLKKGEIRTSDDFYRASWFFHHGATFHSYALAITFAAVSFHLGEPWGKNLYALALDRFLLSIGQPQYFGTQFEKRYGKWKLSPYNKKTTDKERKLYFVEPLKKTLEKIKDFELQEKTKK